MITNFLSRFDNNFNKLVLTIIFFSVYILRFLLDTPTIALAGDEPIKWIIANDLANFKFEKFNIEPLNWAHEIRWGTWVPSFIILNLFGPNLLVYYLTNYIFHLIGLFFFVLVIKKINIFLLALFYSLLFLDFVIYEYASQLLPFSYTLFVLGGIVYFSNKYLESNNHREISLYKYFVTLLLIYGYMIKITNSILYFPFLYFVFKKENIKECLKILILSFVFYLIETYFFSIFDEEKRLQYGRIFALFIGDSDMNNNWYINYYSQFFLSGVFLRFYEGINSYMTLIYFSSLFIILSDLFRYKYLNNLKKILYVNFIAILLCVFFLIHSLNPLVPVHIYIDRYLAILNPICYIIIILYLKDIKIKFSLTTGALTVFFLMLLISNPLQKFWHHYVKNDQKTIFERLNKYQVISKTILSKKYDCISSETQPRVKWLPLILATNDLERNFYENFRFSKIFNEDTKKPKIREIFEFDGKCKETLNIDKFFN